MHEKYKQGRGAGGDIFVFVLTKTKINDDTQSGLHLEKARKLALLVKWRCLKKKHLTYNDVNKSMIMHAKIRDYPHSLMYPIH